MQGHEVALLLLSPLRFALIIFFSFRRDELFPLLERLFEH